MKIRKSYIVLDVLALFSLAGAYYLKYFADRKLGFVRWLNYYDAHLKEAVPVDAIKYGAFAFIALLALVAAVIVFRKKDAAVNDRIMAVVMLCVTAYYLYATISITYEVTEAAFLIVPLIALGTVFLIVRSFTGLKGEQKKQKA